MGYTIGCCLIGYAVRFVSSRRLMLVLISIAFLCHIVLTFYYVNLFIESVLLFVAGFTTSAVVLSYDLAEKVVPSTAYGMAAGFVTMFLALIGMLMVPIIGYLADLLELDIYLASFPVVICLGIAVMIALRINLSDEFAFCEKLTKAKE